MTLSRPARDFFWEAAHICERKNLVTLHYITWLFILLPTTKESRVLAAAILHSCLAARTLPPPKSQLIVQTTLVIFLFTFRIENRVDLPRG